MSRERAMSSETPYRVGPAWVFIGNPNILDGGGMVPLGFTHYDVTVTKVRKMAPMATVPLADGAKEKMQRIVLQSIGGFGTFKKLDNLPTLALIPADELRVGVNGIDAPNAVWIPAVDLRQLTYREVTDHARVTHEAQILGLRLQFDDRASTVHGARLTGTARRYIPPNGRVMLIGSPRSIPDAELHDGSQSYTTNTIRSWSLPPAREV